MDLATLPDCQRCALRAGCGQVVTGLGSPKARIMLVGDYPDAESDLVGEPFSGRNGDYLRKLVNEAGLEAYCTYLVKCMPTGKVKKEHSRTCGLWLWQEIQEVKPKVVVTLGKLPTTSLLRLKHSFILKDVVGKFYQANYIQSLIAPWHDPHQVLNGGAKLAQASLRFSCSVKEKV